MVLSVNSSSTKIVCGFTVAALAVGTLLFYRSRPNAMEQPIASSLANRNVSYFHDLPVIGWLMNYFSKTEKKSLEISKDPSQGYHHQGYQIGVSNSPIESVESLTFYLSPFVKKSQTVDTLVIQGKNLELAKDPGILALKPKKLILIGVHIALSTEIDSLEQLMLKNGWDANHDVVNTVEVDSVEEAENTSVQAPTVFSVRVAQTNSK